MTCPNSYESGCRCVQHHQGLREYASDKAAYDRALGRTRLGVVTMPPGTWESLETACDGSYVCECRACSAEKARLVNAAARRAA